MQSNLETSSSKQDRPLAGLVKAEGRSPWGFLSLLMVTHVFIDVGASMTTPLLKSLGVAHGASDKLMGVLAMFLFGSLSFSQPLFGYIYDRFRAYWMMPVLVVIIGVAFGCLGLVDSFGLLVVLVIVGGLGIGAFHPMGTAMAGSLSERHRSFIVAIFICAGAMGYGGGAWLVSRIVARWELGATVWFLVVMAPVLVISILAALKYRRLPHSEGHRSRQSEGSSGSGFFSHTLLLLFGVASARNFSLVICGTGMSFLMAEKIADTDLALLSTGNASGLLGLALGAGGLLSGLFIHPKSEKSGIIISLAVGGPLLIIFPLLEGVALLVVLGLGAVVLASTIPLVVATGQRLLPHASALASSMLMGVAWGTSGVIAPIAVTWLGSSIGYGLAMPILAGAGVGISLGCTLALPRVMREAEDSQLVRAEPSV